MRTESSGTFPVAVLNREQGELAEHGGDGGGKLRVAQQLGKDDGRKAGLSISQRPLDDVDVRSRLARQEGDHGARIERDHRRSFRSCFQSTENDTRPRRRRSSSYA